MTILQAQKIASKEIGHIETDILLEHILNVDKQYLIINSNETLSKNQEKTFLKFLKKIKNGMPIQYITEKANFMGLEFKVNKNVLIPQPDTEILVEETLKIIKKYKNVKLLDLCTGSGCIAISITKYAENVDAYASDISKKAIEIAKQNSILNKTEKIKFIKSNMFKNINEQFDIIVSNPPYIKSKVIKTLDKQVRKEPKIALNGGTDGLDFYKIIRKNINNYLKPDGYAILEIGFDQKEELQNLFKDAKCIKDLGNNDRVIIWKNCRKDSI